MSQELKATRKYVLIISNFGTAPSCGHGTGDVKSCRYVGAVKVSQNKEEHMVLGPSDRFGVSASAISIEHEEA